MSIGLLGKKIGMTSVYDAKGKLRPVTVIAAGDNTLLRRLTTENDGYSAVQVGFDAQKESRVTKPCLADFQEGQLGAKEACAGIPPRGRRTGRRDQSGGHAVPSRRFRRCHWKFKGKGFQGVMKKHNFAGQGAAHGSKTHRRNGAIGNRSTPGPHLEEHGYAWTHG